MVPKITSYRQIEQIKQYKREKIVLYEEILMQDMDRFKNIFSGLLKSSMWGVVPKLAVWGAKSFLKFKFFKRR